MVLRRVVVVALQVVAAIAYVAAVPTSTTAALVAVAAAIAALHVASWFWHRRHERRTLRDVRPIHIGRVPIRDPSDLPASGSGRVWPKNGT